MMQSYRTKQMKRSVQPQRLHRIAATQSIGITKYWSTHVLLRFVTCDFMSKIMDTISIFNKPWRQTNAWVELRMIFEDSCIICRLPLTSISHSGAREDVSLDMRWASVENQHTGRGSYTSERFYFFEQLSVLKITYKTHILSIRITVHTNLHEVFKKYTRVTKLTRILENLLPVWFTLK